MTAAEPLNPLSPLEPLLQDPTVVEIMVDAPDRVLVQRSEDIELSEVKFDSVEALRAAIDQALALGGASFAAGETICDAQLEDGTRVLGVLPPTAVGSPYLVLRKFFTRGMTWEKLFGYGSVSRETHALLMDAIQAGLNILVSGGAGSGKTTILNLLAESIPAEERIIVIGNAELPVEHPRRIHLSISPQAGLSTSELINTAAKMRPDWVINGELHDAEVVELVRVLSTGYSGMTCLHADSAEQALARLEALYLMANLGLGIAEIRQAIAAAFRLITCQRLFRDGKRRITEVVELTGIENNRYILQPLIRYDPGSDSFERTSARPGWHGGPQ